MTELETLRVNLARAHSALSEIADIATNNRGFHGIGDDLPSWEAETIAKIAAEGARAVGI